MLQFEKKSHKMMELANSSKLIFQSLYFNFKFKKHMSQITQTNFANQIVPKTVQLAENQAIFCFN